MDDDGRRTLDELHQAWGDGFAVIGASQLYFP